MAKGKSSASSATRKKHAAKKTNDPADQQPQQPKEKKPKGRGKKAEPRKKIYIPPTKPAPVQPDPLETTGIAHQLPAELLIILRSLAKKAVVTKGKALEDLKTGWVDRARRDEEVRYTLGIMVPVWMHHVPSLFVHPSRRIRQLAAELHKSFVALLSEYIPVNDVVLATWCMAAHDMDRSVASAARASFTSYAKTIDRVHLLTISPYVYRAALDPLGVYDDLNPQPPPPPAPLVAKRGVPAPDQPVRTKLEDLEEKDEDRIARIRVGALGAISWALEHVDDSAAQDMAVSLSNPLFWTVLHIGQHPSFVDDDGMDGFGFGQPSVRRAGWNIVSTLLRCHSKERIQTFLLVLAPAILRSAWIETQSTVQSAMWQPLLRFLKDFTDAWEVEWSAESHSDSEDDDEDAHPGHAPKTSLAYTEFLQFLELGCGGSPIHGYPTVVIILSTIPSSIFISTQSQEPIRNFFTSFWAAVDGRALSGLNRSAATVAFLSSLFECLVLLLRRIDRGHSELGNAAELLVEQVERVFDGLREGRLKADGSKVGSVLARTCRTLRKDGEEANGPWDVIRTEVVRAPDGLIAVLLKTFLEEFSSEDDKGLLDCARELKKTVLTGAVRRCQKTLVDGTGVVDSSLLLEMLQCFGATLWEEEEEFREALDDILLEHSYKLLTTDSKLFVTFLRERQDPDVQMNVWRRSLDGVITHKETLATSLKLLLDSAEKSATGATAHGVLDEAIHELLVQTLQHPQNDVSLMKQVLERPYSVLSKAGYESMLETTQNIFKADLNMTLRNADVANSLSNVLPLLVILSEAGSSPLSIIPEIFVLAFILPKSSSPPSESSVALASAIWNNFPNTSDAAERDVVHSAVQLLLRDLLADTDVRPLPEHILQAASSVGTKSIDPWMLLPSIAALDALLDRIDGGVIHPSVAVDDVLVPPGSEPAERRAPECDGNGLSSYARIMRMVVSLCAEDRQAARRHVWVLRHLIAFELYADDYVRVPYATSPVFGKTALESLEGARDAARQVVNYLLSSQNSAEERANALDGKEASGLGKVLAEQLVKSTETESLREARILYRMLMNVLNDADKVEADRWVGLARTLEKRSPQTCMSIIRAVTDVTLEPPRLDRYRNELAASFLGIPASKANTDGLLVLQKLMACAPPSDSEAVFLPQPRAVNLIKVLQKWVASDDDDDAMDDDVQSVLTAVLLPLVPILQGLEGSHWDFIFDVLENNLENSALDDDETYITLARSLRVLLVIKDLAATNKMLREVWHERRAPILTLVKELASKTLDNRTSAPRSTCLKLVLEVVQDLPPELIDSDTLPKMCHLITDGDPEVQRTAYMLLQQAAYKRTEHHVVEAAVDTENAFEATLPIELLAILGQSVDQTDALERPHSTFGYLLGWSIVFDLFVGSSLKVKASYIDQLRNLDLISASFMPTVLGLLNLDRGSSKVFRLEPWTIDEFYVSLYEPDPQFSIPVFAAHLFYRALKSIPSLIHSWILECKDRQLTATITSYTAQHFSPVLISSELGSSFAELEDEAFKVRVINAASEVVASYAVDDHQLEMKVKIPGDWPLHRIEVNEGKRVGVDESRWRRWMFAVQQVVWAQNGRIVDALGLFKKNVTLHFEGQVECAICYSIISVMDGTLPQRPCKTCKNRFHGGCLYKWFNTSHSSSCPLCRSDMF